MDIELGVTTTNPNDDNTTRKIEVKLYSTCQVIEAVIGYSIEQDIREQNPNIKIGTEVMLLLDKRNNYYAIASTSQGVTPIDTKNYLIENEENVTIKTSKTEILTDDMTVSKDGGTQLDTLEIETKKISISDGSNEIIAVFIELIDEIIAQRGTGNLNAPVPLEPATILKLEAVKSKITPFKI